MKSFSSLAAAAITTLGLFTKTAWSADIAVLSAGAIEPGIKAAAAAF